MTENTPDVSAMATALATIISGETERNAPQPGARTEVETVESPPADAPLAATTVETLFVDAAGDSEGAGEADLAPAEAEIEIDGPGNVAHNLEVAGIATTGMAASSLGIDLPTSLKDQGSAVAPATTSIFAGFPRAPLQKDEIRIPLNRLVIGTGISPRAYDFDAGPGEALLHAALDPDAIEPVVVTEAGETWPVIDGWARVEALRRQFGDTANVMVRAVLWDGSVRDALYKRFAAVFLTVNSRKVDRSTLLADFHANWAVPQQILAARIGWIKSRVTKELSAARAFAEAPEFARLHLKESDPPIDYLYKVQQARDAAAKDDAEHPKRPVEKGALARLNAKLDALLARPERFATAEALAKLGIGAATKKKVDRAEQSVGVTPAAGDLEIVDCVDGADGEPIAIIETTPDRQLSIRLVVDVATMDERQKEEARSRLREAIDKLLG